MIGSSAPLAERSSSRPLQSTSALLREVLQGSASLGSSSEPPPPTFSAISYPKSLTARLNAITFNEESIMGGFTISNNLFTGEIFRLRGGSHSQHPVSEPQDGVEQFEDDALGESAAKVSPPAPSLRYRNGDMQALMRAFQRRQRQASLLVIGCLATAILLTIGIVLVLLVFPPHGPSRAGLIDPIPPSVPAPKHASAAWPEAEQKKAISGVKFTSASVDRAAGTAALTDARTKILAGLTALCPSG
jgi:hypothetical protein